MNVHSSKQQCQTTRNLIRGCYPTTINHSDNTAKEMRWGTSSPGNAQATNKNTDMKESDIHYLVTVSVGLVVTHQWFPLHQTLRKKKNIPYILQKEKSCPITNAPSRHIAYKYVEIDIVNPTSSWLFPRTIQCIKKEGETSKDKIDQVNKLMRQTTTSSNYKVQCRWLLWEKAVTLIRRTPPILKQKDTTQEDNTITKTPQFLVDSSTLTHVGNHKHMPSASTSTWILYNKQRTTNQWKCAKGMSTLSTRNDSNKRELKHTKWGTWMLNDSKALPLCLYILSQIYRIVISVFVDFWILLKMYELD